MPASSTTRPGQRPADPGGQVVVADRHRVRVPAGPLAHLGRGPRRRSRAATRSRRSASAELHRHDLLQPPGHLGGADDGAGPHPLHPGPVPLPGRDPPPGGRGRRHPHARRGGPGAGPPNRSSRYRQARRASAPTTFCSSTAGTRASSTRPVRPIRTPWYRVDSSRSTGWAGSKPARSSSAPSAPGSDGQQPGRPRPPGAGAQCRSGGDPGTPRSPLRAGPAPPAVRTGPARPAPARAPWPGPSGVSEVRQMLPSASTRYAGSPRPRACTPRVRGRSSANGTRHSPAASGSAAWAARGVRYRGAGRRGWACPALTRPWRSGRSVGPSSVRARPASRRAARSRGRCAPRPRSPRRPAPRPRRSTRPRPTTLPVTRAPAPMLAPSNSTLPPTSASAATCAPAPTAVPPRSRAAGCTSAPSSTSGSPGAPGPAAHGSGRQPSPHQVAGALDERLGGAHVEPVRGLRVTHHDRARADQPGKRLPLHRDHLARRDPSMTDRRNT